MSLANERIINLTGEKITARQYITQEGEYVCKVIPGKSSSGTSATKGTPYDRYQLECINTGNIATLNIWWPEVLDTKTEEENQKARNAAHRNAEMLNLLGVYDGISAWNPARLEGKRIRIKAVYQETTVVKKDPETMAVIGEVKEKSDQISINISFNQEGVTEFNLALIAQEMGNTPAPAVEVTAQTPVADVAPANIAPAPQFTF